MKGGYLMYRNVEAELIRSGLTRLNLANVLSISPSVMSSKLSGKSVITFGEAIKIKDFLNVDITMEELFEFYEEVAAM